MWLWTRELPLTTVQSKRPTFGGGARFALDGRPPPHREDMSTRETPTPHSPGSTPARTLLAAAACLGIPPLALVLAPAWVEGPGALLIWLAALMPAFLLTRLRGWKGASLALAAGMALLVTGQVGLLLLGLSTPPWALTSTAVVLLVVVTMGSGWLAEAVVAERSAAETMALTDPLTGIPNRRHAMIFLEAVWAAARRGQPLSIVLFDLDHFERVNDEHGRAAGDEVLRRLGKVLTSRTRSMDLSARLGGEEFVSILVDCDAESAVSFAEEVRGLLAESAFPWGQVTASAGVAIYEGGMGAPDLLVAAADRALYAAKQAGRDRIRRADELAAVAELGAANAPAVRRGDGKTDGTRAVTALVVDDDPAALRSTRRALESLGYGVEAYTNPFTAVEAVQCGDVVPHVLVTDVVMPEMSGFALVDMLARVVGALPVLYVSGYDQHEMFWSGAPGARSGLLGKPFTIEGLGNEVAKLLDIRAPGRPGAASDGHRAATTDGDGAARDGRRAGARDEERSRAELVSPYDGRILIIDDDPSILRSLQRVFVEDGYRRPEIVRDSRTAAEVAHSFRPDLVILDINMPDVDGFTVMRQLNEMSSDEEFLPMIVFSGDEDPEVRRRALELGATEFLKKPLDVTEALARVRNALRTRFLHKHVIEHRDELERHVRERTWELADTRTEILHRLARAAEYRDDVTGRHAARVGLLASLIAAELGMTADDRELIRRTAPLHDIGKIGIPDAILHKSGSLTDQEFEMMRRHTVIGARILEGGRHRILRMARDIAESHHERWDGDGYPHRLRGDQIPIEARIVAVADTYDVLTHTRPYKSAKSPQAAIDEILRCSGSHFDPDVARAVAAISDRVGPDALPALVDPIDPWSDTGAPDVPTRRPEMEPHDA